MTFKQTGGLLSLGLGVGTIPVLGGPPPITSLLPNQVPGLQLWLKADTGVFSDAGVTLATNGATVQQWNDQSGNGNNATQVTGAARPTYKTNQLNSLPALTFDGVNAYLHNAYAGQPVTVLVVHSAQITGLGVSNQSNPLVASDSASTGEGYNLFGGFYTSLTGTGQWAGTGMYVVNTSGTQQGSVIASSLNTWDILGARGVGQSSYEVWRGINKGATTTFTGTASTPVNPLIGGSYSAHGTVGSLKFTGQIAEVVMYNTVLTAAQYQLVAQGLINKYNMAASGSYYATGMMYAGTATGHFGLYMMQGSDGINWTYRPTNLIPNTANTASLQDPALLLAGSSPNTGGLNWMVSSNYLSNSTVLSHTFDIYSSPDLFTWTFVQHVDCSAFTGTTTGAVANPMWFVDSDNTIHVIVAMSNGSGANIIGEFHPTTPNNLSGAWSAYNSIFAPGTNINGPYLVLNGGTYYLYYTYAPDGTHSYIQVATASSLSGTYTVIESGDWAGWFAQVGKIEQPALLNIGGTWYNYLYNYQTSPQKTMYATSASLPGTPSALTSISTNFTNSGTMQDAVMVH